MQGLRGKFGGGAAGWGCPYIKRVKYFQYVSEVSGEMNSKTRVMTGVDCTHHVTTDIKVDNLVPSEA